MHVFTLLCITYACFAQTSETKDSEYIIRLKKYAHSIKYFPIQKLIFHNKYHFQDEAFAYSEYGYEFYDFMKFTQNATKKELQECVAYLQEATSEEKCLIFVVLHCSLRTEYLPVIAEYVNDQEEVFLTLKFLIESKTQMPAHFPISEEQIRSKIEKGKKLSRLETMLSIRGRISAGPRDFFSPDSFEKRKTVGMFARAILHKWGYKITNQSRHRIDNTTNIYYSIPSEAYWKEYNQNRESSLYYYDNMYITQVECAKPEDYDRASIEFLKKIKHLPETIRFHIQRQCGLYSWCYHESGIFWKERKMYYVFFTPENYPYPCDVKSNLVEDYLKNHKKVYGEKWFNSQPTPTMDELFETFSKNNNFTKK
jgi:hypothetical protein